MTTDIKDLDNEMLLMCFSHLDNKTLSKAALVCHQWNGLMYNPLLLRHRYREQDLSQNARNIIFQKLLTSVRHDKPEDLASIFFYTQQIFKVNDGYKNASLDNMNELNLGFQQLLGQLMTPKSLIDKALLSKMETLLRLEHERTLVKEVIRLGQNALDELKALESIFPFVSLYLHYKISNTIKQNHDGYKVILKMYDPLLKFIKEAAPNQTIFEFVFESKLEMLASIGQKSMAKNVLNIYSNEFFILAKVFEQLNTIELSVAAQRNLKLLECLGHTCEHINESREGASVLSKSISNVIEDDEIFSHLKTLKTLDNRETNVATITLSEISKEFFLLMANVIYGADTKVTNINADEVIKILNSELDLFNSEDILEIDTKASAIVNSFVDTSTLKQEEEEVVDVANLSKNKDKDEITSQPDKKRRRLN